MLAGKTVGMTWHLPDFIGVSLLMALSVALLVFRIPQRLWRLTPDSTYARRLRAIWGAGGRGWAIIRSSLAGTVAVIALTLGLALAVVSDLLKIPSLVGPVLLLVMVTILLGLLHIPIWLWNRPKFLVPPGLRSQPGVLAERRALKEMRRRHPDGVDGSGPLFTDERS